MLPNFLVAGSQKAGTSTLHRVLSLHPEIFLPQKKELNFFFLEREYAKGIEYYERWFEDAPAGVKAVGEASPGYICHPDAPERIKANLPNVKLIMTVRNPIDRAYSQYWSDVRNLSRPHTFEDVVERFLETEYRPGQVGYFSRGVYAPYIKRYLALFPRAQLLILPFDDLRNQPAEFYRRCFEFLGVDPDFSDPSFEQSFNAAYVWDNPVYNFLLDHPRYTKYLPGHLKGRIFRGKKRVIE
jgi:hypothetical protein